MSINATVTLSIGELDSLRNQLKDAQEMVKVLEANEREIKVKVLWDHPYETQVSEYDRYAGIRSSTDSIKTKRFEYTNVENEFKASNKVVTSYVNMTDIIEPLRNKIREEEQGTIYGLRQEIVYLKEQEKKHYDEINDLNQKLRDKELRSKNEKKDKEFEEMHKEIHILKKRLATKELMEKNYIEDIKRETKKRLATKWYHLLFGIKVKL